VPSEVPRRKEWLDPRGGAGGTVALSYASRACTDSRDSSRSRAAACAWRVQSRFDEFRKPVRVEAESSRADLHGGRSERRLRQGLDLGFRDLQPARVPRPTQAASCRSWTAVSGPHPFSLPSGRRRGEEFCHEPRKKTRGSVVRRRAGRVAGQTEWPLPGSPGQPSRPYPSEVRRRLRESPETAPQLQSSAARRLLRTSTRRLRSHPARKREAGQPGRTSSTPSGNSSSTSKASLLIGTRFQCPHFGCGSRL
jgi:hypothetical protein